MKHIFQALLLRPRSVLESRVRGPWPISLFGEMLAACTTKCPGAPEEVSRHLESKWASTCAGNGDVIHSRQRVSPEHCFLLVCCWLLLWSLVVRTPQLGHLPSHDCQHHVMHPHMGYNLHCQWFNQLPVHKALTCPEGSVTLTLLQLGHQQPDVTTSDHTTGEPRLTTESGQRHRTLVMRACQVRPNCDMGDGGEGG